MQGINCYKISGREGCRAYRSQGKRDIMSQKTLNS